MLADALITPSQVQDILKAFTILISTGILAGLIGLIFKAGALVNTIGGLKATIDNDIKPDLKTIRQDINAGASTLTDIKSKVDILWQDRTSVTNSPRVLNDRGKDILENSGIKTIVEDKASEIADAVKQKHPENAYQAEMLIVNEVANLKLNTELVKSIQTGAFAVGSTVDEVLFVGAIHIRDRILKILHMLPEDIDKHIPRS